MEIPGIDTIKGLSFEPPKEQPAPFDLVYGEDRLRLGWNAIAIGIVLYCMVCKEPLVWHSPPNGQVLFHCPKCDRTWIKDSDWDKRRKAHGLKPVRVKKEKDCAEC